MISGNSKIKNKINNEQKCSGQWLQPTSPNDCKTCPKIEACKEAFLRRIIKIVNGTIIFDVGQANLKLTGHAQGAINRSYRNYAKPGACSSISFGGIDEKTITSGTIKVPTRALLWVLADLKKILGDPENLAPIYPVFDVITEHNFNYTGR